MYEKNNSYYFNADDIRFSCGLEDAEDLIADIKQALDNI